MSFWHIAKEHGYRGEWQLKAAEQRKLFALDFLADKRLLRDQLDVAHAELAPATGSASTPMTSGTAALSGCGAPIRKCRKSGR